MKLSCDELTDAIAQVVEDNAIYLCDESENWDYFDEVAWLIDWGDEQELTWLREQIEPYASDDLINELNDLIAIS